jgi:hypothetical protein
MFDQLIVLRQKVIQAQNGMVECFNTFLASNPERISFTEIVDLMIITEKVINKSSDSGGYEVLEQGRYAVKTNNGDFVVEVEGEHGKYYGHVQTKWKLPGMDADAAQLLHDRFSTDSEAYQNVGVAKGLHYALGLITEEQYEMDNNDFDIETE